MRESFPPVAICMNTRAARNARVGMSEMHLPQDARWRNSIVYISRGEANDNDYHYIARSVFRYFFFPLIAKSHIVFGMRAETEFCEIGTTTVGICNIHRWNMGERTQSVANKFNSAGDVSWIPQLRVNKSYSFYFKQVFELKITV